jgi:arsenate reductase
MKCYRVLFLCTGNSARSILGEALLNHLGGGRFFGYSAGSQPKGEVNPGAIEQLAAAGLPTKGLSSKSWEVFAAPDEPPMDLIITVCDSAAGEACPIWPGQPTTAHWGLPDPADAPVGTPEAAAAFQSAFDALAARIRALVALPDEALADDVVGESLAEIHRVASDMAPRT